MTQEPQKQVVITTRQAAELLNITLRAVRDAYAHGRIRGEKRRTKLGWRLFLDFNSVCVYKQRRKENSPLWQSVSRAHPKHRKAARQLAELQGVRSIAKTKRPKPFPTTQGPVAVREKPLQRLLGSLGRRQQVF